MDTIKIMLFGILLVLDGIFFMMLDGGGGWGIIIFAMVIIGSGMTIIAYFADRDEKK